MLEFVHTIVIATIMFAATNADDLVLLALLFSLPGVSPRAVVVGQLVGMGCLTALSYSASALALAFPHGWLPWLGFVPVWIGFRWLRRKGAADSDPTQPPNAPAWWAVAGITLANGADNLGVYIPAFASQTGAQNIVTAVAFLCLTLTWCLFANQLVRHPAWGSAVQHWSRRIAPPVLILIGLWIIAHHPIFGIWPGESGS